MGHTQGAIASGAAYYPVISGTRGSGGPQLRSNSFSLALAFDSACDTRSLFIRVSCFYPFLRFHSPHSLDYSVKSDLQSSVNAPLQDCGATFVGAAIWHFFPPEIPLGVCQGESPRPNKDSSSSATLASSGPDGFSPSGILFFAGVSYNRPHSSPPPSFPPTVWARS